jgi:hypothetical protein
VGNAVSTLLSTGIVVGLGEFIHAPGQLNSDMFFIELVRNKPISLCVDKEGKYSINTEDVAAFYNEYTQEHKFLNVAAFNLLHYGKIRNCDCRPSNKPRLVTANNSTV